MKKPALPVFLLLLAPAFCFSQPTPTDNGLWVFRYGTSRLAEKALFADGSRTRTVEIAWLFYALKREGRWTLIDTGCDDREMLRYFKVEWTDPLVLLREAGIAPEDVSRVLLTHAHFDHIGLADRFPQARLIMSEAARQDAAAHAVPPSLREFFKFSKRIDTFHGKLDVGDNIIMIEIVGHAAGSSIIRLEADKIIVTGDEAYLPENWTGPRPNGTVVNARANAAFLNALHGEYARYLVLSLHDPDLVPGKVKYFRLR